MRPAAAAASASMAAPVTTSSPAVLATRLNYLDADTTTAGDQAFTLTFSNQLSGHAGELIAYQVGHDTMVEGDVDGDGNADFSIDLVNIQVSTITAHDFIL